MFVQCLLNFQVVHGRLLLPLDCLTSESECRKKGFLVTGFLKNLQSHSSNKDDVTKQLCMLTFTFKEEHLQVQFWPLIHT